MRRYSIGAECETEKRINHRLDRLSNTIDDLFQKAEMNEKILRRYQDFELKLLDIVGLEKLLDVLIRNSVEYFSLDCVELWLFDPQLTLKQLLTEDYLQTPNLRLLSSVDAFMSLYGQEPVVTLLSASNNLSLPVFNDLADTGTVIRSVALLPLVRHGILVGSLHFGAKGAQRFTNDKSTDFINHLASVVSVCLENAVNQDRLRHLTMYDMLTQVKNRRAFHKALDEEVSRAARSGDPLSIMFVDLDYFKRINDQYGHPMGDRVLRAVAQHIDTMLRKTDHVCRYGGEEFSLVLPSCSCERAMDVANRIREQVSGLIIVDDNGVEVSVTLSIGVSGWFDILGNNESIGKDEKLIASQLISCSDKGVYLAKASGRNCVHYFELSGDDEANTEPYSAQVVGSKSLLATSDMGFGSVVRVNTNGALMSERGDKIDKAEIDGAKTDVMAKLDDMKSKASIDSAVGDARRVGVESCDSAKSNIWPELML